jgi:RecA-family ATPase
MSYDPNGSPQEPKPNDAVDTCAVTAKVIRFPGDPNRAEAQPDDWEPLIVKGREMVKTKAPKREWLIEGLIPVNNVTLLYGDGGVGKSLLGYQLAIATTSGTEWVGFRPKPGPVVYFSAEDEKDEIHRRQTDIIKGTSITPDDLEQLHVLDVSERDATLAAPDKKEGFKTTRLWNWLVDYVEEVKPTLLIVDTVAETFDGEDVSKRDAKKFVRMFRELALRLDMTVVLLAHPSQSGMSSGRGTNGSVAWSNSARSRLYLRPSAKKEGAQLVLEAKKANRGKKGEKIGLRWRDWRYERVELKDRSAQDGQGVGSDELVQRPGQTKPKQSAEAVDTPVGAKTKPEEPVKAKRDEAGDRTAIAEALAKCPDASDRQLVKMTCIPKTTLRRLRPSASLMGGPRGGPRWFGPVHGPGSKPSDFKHVGEDAQGGPSGPASLKKRYPKESSDTGPYF